MLQCRRKHDVFASSYGSARSTGLHGPLNTKTADKVDMETGRNAELSGVFRYHTGYRSSAHEVDFKGNYVLDRKPVQRASHIIL